VVLGTSHGFDSHPPSRWDAGWSEVFHRSALPYFRGSWREGASLGPMTWLRVGGPAALMVRPADEEDLSELFRRLGPGAPCWTMGVGSNLLVRDGGIPAMVVRLGRGFTSIVWESSWVIRAGAGLLGSQLAKETAARGYQDLTFLAGIPGTVGGALAMNAGAYGRCVADHLLWARVMDDRGEIHQLGVDEIGYRYRGHGLPSGMVFLEGCFRLTLPGDPAAAEARMAEQLAGRAATQPVRARTAGSTFKNPQGTKSAWEWVASVGLQGWHYGGASFSAMHANFLINHGDASAAALETLGELARLLVWEHHGVQLEWEVRRLGIPLHDQWVFSAEPHMMRWRR
jgi:UDP-N-acetylmuramate dehydrogenase